MLGLDMGVSGIDGDAGVPSFDDSFRASIGSFGTLLMAGETFGCCRCQ
jgi:hypothetical protein